MNEYIEHYFYRILCIFQRLKYKIIFYKIDIYPWHLSGTLYCRKYKIKTLQIINRIKPDFYIDIGCGLGEILNKANVKESNKFGFDIDKRLNKAIKKANHKFHFSSNKIEFFDLLKTKVKCRKGLIIVTLLNFSHKISEEELLKYLKKLNECLGSYILITDSIFDNSKEYQYSHKSFLDKQEYILEYIERIDQIRSLYCISFDNNIIV
mgnify:CR=1 FL=1|tara:strand:+ start:45212 stop:45835 length:624 start_codon:yes stop_codon:yes gene_type:complete